MRSFAVTLDSLMKEARWSQSELYRQTNATVGQGLISGYLNDGSLPEKEMLARLVSAFDGVIGKDAGNALVAAWLLDQLPKDLRSRVEITPRNGSTRVMETPLGPPGYADLPRRVRDLIDEVTTKAGTNRQFLTALETTVALTRR